jgi:G3E family GTPase
MPIPVIIITGYLGSGKTSLVNHLVNVSKERLAILMNEFGEIAVDSKIIQGKNFNLVELAGGCACCSLTGELDTAVREITEKVKPERIIIETTGVAEPEGIIVSLEGIPQVRLDSVITIVDADAMTRFPQLGHTGMMQIEGADIVVVNKIDLVDADQLDTVIGKIRNIKEDLIITKAINGKVPLGFISGIKTRKATTEHAQHVPEEESFAYRSDRRINLDKFKELANSLPKEIIRSKGFLFSSESEEGKGYLFDYVNGRWNIKEYDRKKTELVFVGKNIGPVKGRIIERLEACERE